MNILVFAPHPDDEILGVGATMARYIANGDKVFVCIITRGYEPICDEQQALDNRKASVTVHSFLGVYGTYYLDFPAVMLENVPRYEINARICALIEEIKPDVVFIPHHGDMQKDHQIVCEAVMVATRPKYSHRVKEIYAYETLSETEWNIQHPSNTFYPNVYIDISDFLQLKIDAMKRYPKQLHEFPNPRSLNAISSLAMYRGSTINVNAAEAFMTIRVIK